MRRIAHALAALALTFPAGAQAATFMDAAWAAAVCTAWNSTPELSQGLAGKSLAVNNARRGYQVIQLYRTRCGEGGRVELHISNKGGKAECTYGGAVKTVELNPEVDYLMHASDEDWTCMGEGKFGCGALGAMITGKLKLEGPKGEARGVVSPFDTFLQLTGKIPGDKSACP